MSASRSILRGKDMTYATGTGVGEPGYRPLEMKKRRAPYAAPRVLIQWDRHEIGQKAKMIAHMLAEIRIGSGVMEVERKFGMRWAQDAADICINEIPGFVEWYTEQAEGEDPDETDTTRTTEKHRVSRCGYRLYQRVFNAYYDMNGRKYDLTRAGRSREHYMHESKVFLRRWKPWAMQVVQRAERFKVFSKPPRNETKIRKVL